MDRESERLAFYACSGYRRVSGWLGPDTVAQVIRLNRVQAALGVHGPVGEIGVHHGKLFILLYLLAGADEAAVAVDIFDQQELNIDKSGKGNLDVLLANLDRYAGGHDRLRVISADSTTINASTLREAAGGALRLLSVDGGHLAPIVRHDLNTAMGAICDGGVVMVDDYCNPEFPGVAEGVNAFFASDNERNLVPFYVGMNKLYVTTSGHAAQYMEAFALEDVGVPLSEMTAFRAYEGRQVPVRLTELFGARVLSYSADTYSIPHRVRRSLKRGVRRARGRLSETALWARLRHTAIGAWLRRVASQVVPY